MKNKRQMTPEELAIARERMAKARAARKTAHTATETPPPALVLAPPIPPARPWSADVPMPVATVSLAPSLPHVSLAGGVIHSALPVFPKPVYEAAKARTFPADGFL